MGVRAPVLQQRRTHRSPDGLPPHPQLPPVPHRTRRPTTHQPRQQPSGPIHVVSSFVTSGGTAKVTLRYGDLKANTTYAFRTSAYNGSLYETDWSTWEKFTTRDRAVDIKLPRRTRAPRRRTWTSIRSRRSEPVSGLRWSPASRRTPARAASPAPTTARRSPASTGGRTLRLGHRDQARPGVPEVHPAARGGADGPLHRAARHRRHAGTIHHKSHVQVLPGVHHRRPSVGWLPHVAAEGRHPHRVRHLQPRVDQRHRHHRAGRTRCARPRAAAGRRCSADGQITGKGQAPGGEDLLTWPRRMHGQGPHVPGPLTHVHVVPLG